ncbi:hypothetical protein WG66_002380 [Moniliophthora roreri]|nr:hypothetical protein WG66_002380 [Moniliophthora roreri]
MLYVSLTFLCGTSYFRTNHSSTLSKKFTTGSMLKREDVLQKHALSFKCMEKPLLRVLEIRCSFLLDLPGPPPRWNGTPHQVTSTSPSGVSNETSRTAFPTWNISLPPDSECSLTATTNVFGRHVNSIAEGEVCVKGAGAKIATGEFVHVEQAPVATSEESYEAWIEAVRETFGTV